MAKTSSESAHRHKDSRKLWTTFTEAHAHDFTETSHPADALTQAEVDGLRALLAPVPPPVIPPPVIPPPSGGATPNIPSSIDPTGSQDVTSAITSWLQGLPAGSTAVFGNGATYRCDGQIHLTNHPALRVDQNASTILQTPRGNSPIILIDQGGNDIIWTNYIIKGPNPNPGLWDGAYEHNHGFAIGGVLGFELGNGSVINVGGDGAYLSGGANRWATNVHIHDATFSGIGRMAIAITDGLSGGLIETSQFDHIGYYLFDIEPNGATVGGRLAGAEHVKFLHNTIGPIPYGRNPVVPNQATGYAFCTTNASAKGTQPIINDIEVGWNTINDPAWPDFRLGLFAPQATAILTHDNVR